MEPLSREELLRRGVVAGAAAVGMTAAADAFGAKVEEAKAAAAPDDPRLVYITVFRGSGDGRAVIVLRVPDELLDPDDTGLQPYLVRQAHGGIRALQEASPGRASDPVGESWESYRIDWLTREPVPSTAGEKRGHTGELVDA